jgi:hypothetical protein
MKVKTIRDDQETDDETDNAKASDAAVQQQQN